MNTNVLPQSQDVSRETQARLAIYVDLLRRWNTTTGLVSRTEAPGLLDRHIADSLNLVSLLAAERLIADLGSGGGLPGLVLAIATGRHIALIEANHRKAAFLREAIRVTGASASVLANRIEALTEKFELITARAVAPLTELLGLVTPRLAPAGRCLFLKGRNYAAELAEANALWRFQVREHQSITAPESRILEISDIHARLRK